MKHYTNKKTNEVFGYESIEDAKKYNNDFENLVEMTDELFQEYREQKQGHKWSLNGWIEDEELMKELMKELEEQNRQQAIADLQAEKAQTLQQMQMEILLGNTELAIEHAKRVKEIEAEIETLRIEG